MRLTIGEYYIHIKSGNIYRVMTICNREATKGNDRFPLTVVYDDDSGDVWSRPLEEFVEKFEEVL